MTFDKKGFLAIAGVVALAASPAVAGPGHKNKAGEPGDAAKADRTVTITAKETDDGRMIFEPASLKVQKGTTVRIVVDNVGEIEHELYLGTHEAVEKHAAQMMKMSEMEHAEPNAVRVDPGHQGEIAWRFTETGEFTYACLIPGHMESGMVGSVEVLEDLAEASTDIKTN